MVLLNPLVEQAGKFLDVVGAVVLMPKETVMAHHGTAASIEGRQREAVPDGGVGEKLSKGR